MNKTNTSIPVLKRSGITATEDGDKASMLNKYFSECFNMAQPSLSANDRANFEVSGECPVDFMCTEEEVYNLLISMDTTKANGPDRISAKILRETATSITPSLTKLFNISILPGKLPEKWKVSSIVPISKASDRASLSNYRPTSLLPVVSKMHFHHLIADYLSEHRPLVNTQWGSQSGKGTFTALLATTYDWFTHLEAGRDVSSIFFDLRKAFDTVPHRALMTKLQQLNVSPFILRWICSYLTARQQKAVIGGEESKLSQSSQVYAGFCVRTPTVSHLHR